MSGGGLWTGRFTGRLRYRSIRFGRRRNKRFAETSLRSVSYIVANLTLALRKFVGEEIGNLVGQGVEVNGVPLEGRESETDTSIAAEVDVYGGPLARKDAKVKVSVEIQ